VDGWVDDDVVALRIRNSHEKNAKRVRTAKAPGTQAELTPAQAYGGFAPAVCAVDGYAAYNGRLIAGDGGFIYHLHPNSRHTAMVLDFKLFAEPVPDRNPAEPEPPIGTEPSSQEPDPNIGHDDQSTQSYQQRIPYPAWKEERRDEQEE
jgi:hypothetical protein